MILSWKPEIQTGGKWYPNNMVFATEQEAKDSARALFMRWTVCNGHRAVEVDTAAFPVNYVRVDGVDKPKLLEVNSELEI